MESIDSSDNIKDSQIIEKDESSELKQQSGGLTVSTMDDMLSRRKDLPEDLACFLQQQKQRQARLETTMRSFPSTEDMEQDKNSEFKKKRNTHEDPMSHRIIEKRRRDRMNNCLADLSRLIPSSYLKKGRGRIEKTEIIEMAIKHIRHLQNHPCTKQEGCELAGEIESGLNKASSVESFRVGYHECLTETMHFLVEREGLYSGNSFCVRLMSHLQKHFDKLGRASTSELISGNVPGRTWPSDPRPETQTTANFDREKVKSEFGVSSEESGYKTDEPSAHGLSSLQDDGGGSVRGLWPPEVDQGEQPSDLSLSVDTKDSKLSAAEDLSMSGASLYKFKSNIRHRFDSSRSVDDERDGMMTEKRTRLDSTSTDVDPTIDVELDSRRECLSPGQYFGHTRHRSGPAAAPDPSTSPPPGPSQPSSSRQQLIGQYIPVFALSTSGSHYLPLTLEASNLIHYLPYLAETSSGPLHPVTISVKFSPSSLLSPPGPGPLTPLTDGHDSGDWSRQARRGGVIHTPQSVIKQNWRGGDTRDTL